MHLVAITKAKYKNDYQILLSFDDGKKGIVDLKNFIFSEKRNVFQRLKDKEIFKNFSIKFDTIAWGDDLDLAPEFLHDLLEQQNN